ncbi:MAG: alcohol dehydrogenase catalytic domain-containing protein [Pseudomonadota bacterium]
MHFGSTGRQPRRLGALQQHHVARSQRLSCSSSGEPRKAGARRETVARIPSPAKSDCGFRPAGVCHSDAANGGGACFRFQWPRVPGHEAVGVIDALGEGVQGWTVGQRVGVGFLGGSCGYCEFCRGGDLVSCKNQEYTGHPARRRLRRGADRQGQRVDLDSG